MGGWLYKHENITNSASNSVEVGAGAELGKTHDAVRLTFVSSKKGVVQGNLNYYSKVESN